MEEKNIDAKKDGNNSKSGKSAEQRSKKDNTYVVDIRKLPNVKRVTLPNFVTIALIAVAIFVGIFLFNIFSYKGEEVSVSTIVSDIAEKNYDKIVLKDDMVVLESSDKVNDVPVVKKKYALLPGKMDFYQVLSDSDIDIRDLGDDFYEPNVGITLGDVLTIVFMIGAGVLLLVMIKNMQNSGGKMMDFG